MATTKTATTNEPPPPLRPLAEGLRERLLDPKPQRFIPSGLASLDEIILGAMPTELLAIAGDTTQGKTSLAVQWGVFTAQKIGAVAMLSLEMKGPALQDRILSGLTGIPTKVFRTGIFENKTQRADALEAEVYLKKLPFLIDDRSYVTPEKVYDAIMSWPKQDVVLGIVDYIQFIRGTNDSRAVQVSEAVHAVKAGARDSGLPVIGISSVNRSSGTREDRKPRTSDLKESGDLEFTVDTLLMFHYPNAPDDFYDQVRDVDIHVMKQRNGPTGVASARFNKPATRFEPVGGE